ncbi:hypothetical protein D6C99_09914 [Aureobasidium pullulans]|uniref:histidine kinase n=1 Tax=Aureobasidium pullulans TaxID=5580 RepID=A0A4S8SFK9_AURPU|nr:hypothetical protein D6D29_10061 [Aureobasidium pullulans]THW31164.1 hypothetical protein D6D22_10318 [Aureobasidium pullulans]THY37117.1 hypothetical protein D6C99_09914 [Aureobasidium pullulans]
MTTSRSNSFNKRQLSHRQGIGAPDKSEEEHVNKHNKSDREAINGHEKSREDINGHDKSKEDQDKLDNTKKTEADWTSHIPHSEHNQFLINTRWDKTSLGRMRTWPPILQLMTLKMLADPRPANLYWGQYRIAIYNEPFAVMAHSRHPAMMGATAADAMPATWPFLKVMMQQVQDTNTAFSLPEFEMEVHKANGFLEEAWYDGIFSPISDTNGRFQGLYNSGYEITNTVLMHRYARLIHRMAATPDFDHESPWTHIVKSCEEFGRDVPMLLVYSAHVKPTSRSYHCTLHLKGSLGIKPPQGQALNTFDLDDSDHVLAPAFRSSKSLGHPVLLDTSHESFQHFRSGIDRRGYLEPSSRIVVMPVLTTGLIAGFIVMGLNPRRPYDDDLKQLVRDIWLTCTSVLSSSISFDQAREREKVLTRELTQRERFIRKLAEVTNVGIYSLSLTGILTYANPKFHDMLESTLETENSQVFGFEHFVLDDDLHKLVAAHEDCKAQCTNVSVQIRLKRTWFPPGSLNEQPCWVLNSIVPDVEDGQIKGVIGSLSDIGHTMWALQLQKDSTEAALESKKHLEQFIDMTSHEMRNPLGATIQCAEDIARTIDEARVSFSDKDLSELFESVSENAKTIAFCSAHQRSIADDILVVSKLSSSLLSLSSASCQPETVAKQVVRMFKAEAANATVDLDLEVHSSYSIDWASCDASRIRQILINLVSNSLKFTKGRNQRQIKVIVGSSHVAPPEYMSDLQWHPKELPPPVLSANNEIFLTLQVQDTGKGLSREEMEKLFNRFAQASSTTSSTYGGSGLGLFISMQLAELQGGRIGLSSQPGQGSTFGFYVKEQEQSLRRISETLENHLPRNIDKPLDILLVEDNVINARILSKQLRAKGHQVHVAIHGQEALDYLRTTKYSRGSDSNAVELDVILMDWEMPVLNGIDCTKQIRQLEAQGSLTTHLPIIVTSANARPKQIEVAYAAGTDEFLSKPFTVTQVLQMND